MKTILNDILDIHNDKHSLLKKADKPKLGWLSIYTPEEIIHAAGVIPFRITGESVGINHESSALMHRTVCSYVLACLSEGLEGVYNYTDGIIVVDACDARKRINEVWNEYIKPEFSYFIELPKDNGHASKEYFRLQVRKFMDALERKYNCKITDEKLWASIKIYNETRQLLQKLYELRKNDNKIISSSEVIHIIKSSMVGFKEEFNQQLSQMLVKMENEPEKDAGKKNKRILLCGSYFDYRNISECIEKFGGNVVCEDISNGLKYITGVESHAIFT